MTKITLIGNSPDKTIIRGTSRFVCIGVLENVNVLIEGLTITRGQSSGIYFEGNLTLKNVIITDNKNFIEGG
ncbi:MAG: hypothetical protein PHY59_04690 [Methanobacterium sp.]|nr:hypothetical protein [Methanobacterium sp.]